MAAVIYLVAPSIDAGAAYAQGRGWARISRDRFAIAWREGARVITKISDLSSDELRLQSVLPMIKVDGYEDALSPEDFDQFDFSAEAIWSRDKVEFDKFVKEGRGEWID